MADTGDQSSKKSSGYFKQSIKKPSKLPKRVLRSHDEKRLLASAKRLKIKASDASPKVAVTNVSKDHPKPAVGKDSSKDAVSKVSKESHKAEVAKDCFEGAAAKVLKGKGKAAVGIKSDVESKIKKKPILEDKKRKLEKDMDVKEEDLHNKRGFFNQCRPTSLFNIIQRLTDSQKRDVESMGFGGLLHLGIAKNSTCGMIKWLVSHFNPSSRILGLDNFRRIPITADDVYDVFMIPRNEGVGVPVYSRSVGEFDLLNRFQSEYGISPGAKVSILDSLIIDRLSGGEDDFKRVFLLYSLFTFLTPTPNYSLNTGVLKSTEDVSLIPTFDWCSFVLERLCQSVSSFMNSQSGYVGGCTMLLQIIYFHRLQWHGVVEPCLLPLIRHWTYLKVAKRCREEAKAKIYGDGELVVGRFPLSKNGKVARDEDVSGEKVSGKRPTEDVEENNEDVDHIRFDIPDCELKNSVLKKSATDPLHEILLFFKRDISIVSNFYMSKLFKVNRTESDDAIPSSTPESMDSQKFFSDPRVHAIIDDVVKNFLRFKNMDYDGPTFNILTPSPVVEKDGEVSDDDEVVAVEELSSAVKSFSARKKSASDDLDIGCLDIDETVGYVSQFLEKWGSLLSVMDVKHK